MTEGAAPAPLPDAADALRTEELREAWPVLGPDERIDGFRLLPPSEASDFFLALSTRDQAGVLAGLSPGERRLWLRLLPPDDLADVLQELDPEARREMFGLLDPLLQREVAALMAYAEDDAGGLMNTRFARVRPDMTADEAIRYLRRQARDRQGIETIYYVYVLDAEQRLLGVVSFREIFAAPAEKLVREIMHTDVISVPDEMDQEKVARVMQQNDILAVPVVDEQRRMKGIITWDDVQDVVQEEATEDIHKIGGTAALDTTYLQTSALEMVKKRAGWLGILFLGELLTANAMKRYETHVEQALVLALFVPLIISSGGNSGSQASTLVIRAMALGEVKLKDWWRVVRREIASGLALGSILAVLGLVRVWIGHQFFGEFGEHWLLIGVTVALSLVGVATWGTIAGSMLPFLLTRFRLDPASASAPFVATLVDVSGLIIYFSVAQTVLKGTLL